MFSQNTEQRLGKRFSYTHYDHLARPTATGEGKSQENNWYFQNHFNEPAIPPGSESLLSSLNKSNNGFGGVQYQNGYNYDDIPTWALKDIPADRKPRNLRGKLAVSCRYSGQYIVSYCYYSYNDDGLLEWSSQQFQPEGEGIFIAPKVIDYEYDAFGSMTGTIFQKNVPSERFEHVYKYDLAKRLSEVKTRAGSESLNLGAKYKYYIHGPLKRKEMGGTLQGIDYLSTIQGWLKSINNPTLNGTADPGFLIQVSVGEKDLESYYASSHENVEEKLNLLLNEENLFVTTEGEEKVRLVSQLSPKQFNMFTTTTILVGATKEIFKNKESLIINIKLPSISKSITQLKFSLKNLNNTPSINFEI